MLATCAVAGLAIAGFSALGQMPPAQQPKAHLYTSPDLFFEVEIPAGWDYRNEEGSNEILVLKGDVSVSVAVTPIEEGDPAQKFLDVNKKMLKQQCPSAELRAEGTTKVAGVEGAYFSMFCPGPRLPTLVRISTAIQYGHFFVFNVTAPSEQWAAMQPVIDRMAQSFKAGEGLPEGREPRKRTPR